VVIPNHVADLQVFVVDHIIGAHKSKRCLVVKVLPLTANCLVRLGKVHNRLAPTMAALLAFRDAPLAFGQVALRSAIAPRREDARTIRQWGEGFYPKVYARFLPCRREKLRRYVGAGG
jgi:hypothetical protein